MTLYNNPRLSSPIWAERNQINGTWEVSAFITDDWGQENMERRWYMGYTKREAIAEFKEEMGL